MGFFNRFRNKNADKKYQAEDYSVKTSDQQVSVSLPSGSKSVKWEEIKKINYHNTTDGPFYPDVFLQLCSDSETIEIPIDAQGYEEVYNIVSKYEGFDFKGTIIAMTTAGDTEEIIPVWGDRSSATSAPPPED